MIQSVHIVYLDQLKEAGRGARTLDRHANIQVRVAVPAAAICRMLMASAKIRLIRICCTFHTCSKEENSATWATGWKLQQHDDTETFQSFLGVALR